MKNYLLFDLDGTLSDPKIGICTCVQYALASFGIEEPDLDKLECFIGPPLKTSFMEFYQMPEEQAEAAVAKYRERFSDVGLFENALYPGIPEMLRALNAKGMHLAVASSKPTVFVEKILEHFEIKRYFQVIVGSELDGTRSNKDEVVAEALRQLFGEKEVDREDVYMIGDRKFDVEGAKIQGVESVGVTYGYGSMEELREARADFVVQSVEELKRFLLRGTDDAPKGLDLQRLWKTAYPLVLFLLVKTFVVLMGRSMMQSMGGSFFGVQLLYRNADDILVPTANGGAILNLFGFAAGAAAIWKGSRIMIARAAEESRLLHLRKDSASSYAYIAFAAMGIMFSMNLFLQLAGAAKYSSSFQEVSSSQFAVNPILGILLYGAVAPFAEELLFRGIIYNGLKRSLKATQAMLLAAAVFGAYHRNAVQGIAAFLMGCLFIYAYEYFGDFKVCVALHSVCNLLSFFMGLWIKADSPLLSWPVLFIGVMLVVVCMVPLLKSKKVFKIK